MRARQTGYTSKLKLRAALEFLAGNNVLVIAHTTHYAESLCRQTFALFEKLGLDKQMQRKADTIFFQGKQLKFCSSYIAKSPQFQSFRAKRLRDNSVS